MQWNSPDHPEMTITTGQVRPVNRVFCIGRNYEAHAREMGAEVDRAQPFHFQKSFDAVTLGPTVHYPSQTEDLHHEVELVVVLGQGGRDVTPVQAKALVFGYACGIDFTRRDRQTEAKAQGRPWEMAKNFDEAAALGVVAPVDDVGHLTTGRIQLSVNDVVRQQGDLDQMVYDAFELIAYLSRAQTLKPGDLIYTGTPAGVGAVGRGDHLTCQITGLPELSVQLV
jgi:fumarylpyruvate hydrolase